VNTREYVELRQWLVHARKSANLTQQQLAAKLKRPQSFVAKYEIGERRLDLIEFLEVVRIIGVNPLEIIARLSTTVDRTSSHSMGS
jgi:transcriptional regulator with XRE-family HTH domain